MVGPTILCVRTAAGERPRTTRLANLITRREPIVKNLPISRRLLAARPQRGLSFGP